MASVATFYVSTYRGSTGTESAVSSRAKEESIGIPSAWYVLTIRDLTAAKTEVAYRLDAEAFEISQSLSRIYDEEEQDPELFFLDEAPIVYFPPTRTETFTMEVTQKRQGRVEGVFTTEDLESLINIDDI